jgi:hypothetical protein
MGIGGSKLTFAPAKIVPLVFQPKPKDESNKLRRKNSLYEAIVDYLNHLDEGDNGIQELIDEASLAALVAQDKKEVAEDPRIAGLNAIADEVATIITTYTYHYQYCYPPPTTHSPYTYTYIDNTPGSRREYAFTPHTSDKSFQNH